ncbi:hypothetical protein [uncultured Duncaniella sp.]|uniref:hypothetical protein n=1 Tax=uncultured Duncaniella sp. TaxID=2768039 RepID=UPI0026762A85|nr:hypothetical protein [uncultured Duncaniella sp.]
MTLYDLFHSIPPEVLMASVMEVNAHNNVVSNLEASFLPGVLNALPDKSYDDEKCLYILRDYQFRPVVAFDTSLDAEITLGKVLSRQVMTCNLLKHLPPEKIAAYCYCSLPVCIVVEKDGHCPVSRAYDQDTKSIITKVYDNILLY